MFIQYGVEDNYLDITECLLKNPNPIIIPGGDEARNLLFGDPVPYQYKHIRITHETQTKLYGIGDTVVIYIFKDLNHTMSFGCDYQSYPIETIIYSHCYFKELLVIPSDLQNRNLLFGDPMMGMNKQIMIDNINYGDGIHILIYIPKLVIFRALNDGTFPITILRLGEVTHNLHKRHHVVSFCGGNPKINYELQLLVALFLQSHNSVLQLEADQGQVTLTIANLLQDSHNLVAMTSKIQMVSILNINRELNHDTFSIEYGTLSYQLLVLKGDDLLPYEPGSMIRWSRLIKTITYEALEEKYQIKFDTLVAGNLWHLKDHLDHVLGTIKTLILSNGYYEWEHKIYIDNNLIRLGFKRVYVIKGGWGPCVDCFYEVWLR